MPEENPLPEVIERVAHAVEKNTPSEPPKGKKDRLKSLASFLTAAAALVAALGAFLKTCDHSLTENAYNTLSGQIEKLSDQQQKNHEDLVALQGYLDGLSHAPLVPAGPAPSASAMAGNTDAGTTLHPLIRPPATASATAMTIPDAGPTAFAVVAPPLPSVHPKPPPVKPPPWAQVEAK